MADHVPVGEERQTGGHPRRPRIAVGVAAVVVLVVLVAAGLWMKRSGAAPADSEGSRMSSPVSPVPTTSSQADVAKARPRLVDLGAGTCVPCKMMAPILDELRETYKEELEVIFIDVREDRAAAKEYGITVIPTQIFYDASGKELFRHQGFFSREDILAKWKELEVELGG